MNSVNNKCKQVSLWVVTLRSHRSFEADPSHQCSNHPSGQTAPLLAVWTVGAIGGDALRACRAIKATAHLNGHARAMCGPAIGSPTVNPKLGTSCVKLGLWQGYPRDISSALLMGSRSTIAFFALLDTAFFCGIPLTLQSRHALATKLCTRLSFGG